MHPLLELTNHKKADYFALPPSGHLYAYPGEMPEGEQAAFAADTERDAALLNTSATVHWEWFGTWQRAIEHFMPRYCGTSGDRSGGDKTAVVRSLFPVNVPFLFPMPEGHFPPGEHYRLIDSPTTTTTTTTTPSTVPTPRVASTAPTTRRTPA